MTTHEATVARTGTTVTAATGSQMLQILSVMMLGLSMLYVAGFLQTSEVHNAAHDMRHSIGFPCH